MGLAAVGTAHLGSDSFLQFTWGYWSSLQKFAMFHFQQSIAPTVYPISTKLYGSMTIGGNTGYYFFWRPAKFENIQHFDDESYLLHYKMLN